MFEILGIALVCFVAWKIISGLISGGVRGHMGRSVAHAMSLGVPHDFAKRMILERDIMKTAVAHMAKMNPDSRLKDVYEQNGEAIAMMYQGYLSEQGKRS